jgi:hypothetical protein
MPDGSRPFLRRFHKHSFVTFAVPMAARVITGGDMQILTKRNEMLLLSIISLMSFTANLPLGSLRNFVDQRMLLVTLGTSVVIALFHYLQLLLSTVMLVSSVGASLPPELASTIGIHPPVLTATLAIIVCVALLNRAYKLLPTGIAPKNNTLTNTEESRLSLLAAITKGDQATLLRLLATNVEINFVQDGTAPILLAAEKGYSNITQILTQHGVNFRIRNEAGLTPIEIALSKKFIRTAEILYLAEKEYPEKPGQIAAVP